MNTNLVLGFSIALTCLAATGFVPHAFAEAVNDFDAVGEYECTENSSSLDVHWVEVYCTSGWCSVLVLTCGEGPLDPDAKYRIHFDTEEPYFWQDDFNESCMTTSDQTAMYRPGRGKYTGPKPWYANIGDNFISLAFNWDDLGVEEGDYIAVWVDIQKKGIMDRAPETDSEDGCAKPQFPQDDGFEFGILGEAMIVCAGGECAGPPPD
jgi:hypothetical protein